MIKINDLPLPERYSGGYLHMFSSSGVLITPDGESREVPQQRHSSRPGGTDRATAQVARQMLAMAPEGAIYIHVQHGELDADGNPVQEHRGVRFIRRPDGWAAEEEKRGGL